MKVLIIHVGTPVDPQKYPGEELHKEPTLTYGTKYFRHYTIVNNMQTRESLKGAGMQVDHIYFTGRKNPYNCLKASLKIRKLVKENGYDLVNQYWGGLSSLFASVFCPCPYVVSLLGSDLYGQYKQDGSKTMMGRMLALFSQLTGIFSNGVIVMSEKMKQKMWPVSRKKTIAIPEGISKGIFYPIDNKVARKHLGWDEKQPVILFFPSAAYVKNTPLARAAVEKVKEQMPNTGLVMAHNIPHRDLVWYYNAADVLIMTSYHEGSNNSIKEAMACDLPVVSVDVGDGKERLERVHPSVVVKTFEPQHLAEAILPILKERQRSNGSAVVHEVELPHIASRIVAFYKTILKRPQTEKEVAEINNTTH
ncbi:MAG: glycosyltransferase family 4 protein [Bacteroidota bacterium]